MKNNIRIVKANVSLATTASGYDHTHSYMHGYTLVLIVNRIDRSLPSLRGALATKQSMLPAAKWIASRSLSSGAHSRDPLARNDGCHTIIITGFSISILNAPISSAPSAPSTAR